jgi:hypothetical protein
MTGNPMVTDELYGIQPELRRGVLVFDMNVRGFVALVAVEE